jgi:hypothetical protein
MNMMKLLDYLISLIKFSSLNVSVKNVCWFHDILFYNNKNSIYFNCNDIEQVIIGLDQYLWIVRYSIKSERLIICDNDYFFISYKVQISILELFNNQKNLILFE